VRISRRAFVSQAAAAGAGVLLSPTLGLARQSPPVDPRPLASRFPDLPRHFIFEYYAWYGTDPWVHWDQSRRRPPIDIASNYMPALGPYDSRARGVIEQHARWIKQSGAGAINLSWWGRESAPDSVVHDVMDVMAAHDVHVTFHIEPYGRRRAADLTRDVQYLIREFGERRHWDCFLLLANADGNVGPVFKTYATIEAPESRDCHGNVRPITDWVRDEVWREQTGRVRDTFRRDFDHITLLADSSAVDRVKAAGFDGMAIYDNFVEPETWPIHARNFTGGDLLFSFNINAGFDGIIERGPTDDCYRPPDFMPGRGSYDWTRPEDREAAHRASLDRIQESLDRSIAVQTDTRFTNAQRGFFVAYINSFNEWHEGTQFEPVRPRDGLTRDELAVGYHNHENGTLRLEKLRALLQKEIMGM
jgi:glycoprotein endo-alpha-1,2-mannosidase